MIPVSAAAAAAALTVALILETAGQVTPGRWLAVTGLVFLVAAILFPPRRPPGGDR